jgi:L-alanine-DL-glutamate epimerase-like enolase superfamily enzyme
VGGRPAWDLTLRRGELVARADAAPLPAFGTETPERCGAALAAFLRAVDDLTEAQFEAAIAGDAARDALLDPLADAPCARAAAEAALLTLGAARVGRSLAACLSPDAARRVAANALIVGDDPVSVAASVRRARARGFDTLKLKVAGRPLDEDRARVEAARAAAGPGVRLRLDANGGWTVNEALVALRALAGDDVEGCEQPVAAIDDLLEVASRAVVPVLADEALLLAGAAERLIWPGTPISGVVLKPAALGGPRVALALGRRASALGLRVVVTHLMDGPWSRASAAHVAAATGAAGPHGLDTPGIDQGAASDRYTPVSGWIAVPTGAGVEPP